VVVSYVPSSSISISPAGIKRSNPVYQQHQYKNKNPKPDKDQIRLAILQQQCQIAAYWQPVQAGQPQSGRLPSRINTAVPTEKAGPPASAQNRSNAKTEEIYEK
jgi:hypothetical protein